MSNKVKFVIDGKECQSDESKYLVEAAKDNGVYIPTLCNYEGLKPKGSCRICTVKINGRLATACTSPVHEGMKIENDTAELNEVRKEIIELLFVSGNHFCPGFSVVCPLGPGHRAGTLCSISSAGKPKGSKKQS